MIFLSVEFAYILLSIREVDEFFLVDCFVGFAVKFVYVTKVSYKLAVSLLVHFRHFEDISIHSAFKAKNPYNVLPTQIWILYHRNLPIPQLAFPFVFLS